MSQRSEEQNRKKHPLKAEIDRAIASFKDEKTPGCDKILAEIINESGEEEVEAYRKLCTKTLENG